MCATIWIESTARILQKTKKPRHIILSSSNNTFLMAFLSGKGCWLETPGTGLGRNPVPGVSNTLPQSPVSTEFAASISLLLHASCGNWDRMGAHDGRMPPPYCKKLSRMLSFNCETHSVRPGNLVALSYAAFQRRRVFRIEIKERSGNSWHSMRIIWELQATYDILWYIVLRNDIESHVCHGNTVTSAEDSQLAHCTFSGQPHVLLKNTFRWTNWNSTRMKRSGVLDTDQKDFFGHGYSNRQFADQIAYLPPVAVHTVPTY